MPRALRTLLPLAATVVLVSAVSAAPVSARSPVRVCDTVVLRVVPWQQTASVLHVATKIEVRGMRCRTARIRIGDAILQAGAASPEPPPCCGQEWYANEPDWWRKHGWRVTRGTSGDPKAKDGARFVVKRRGVVLRFTRWA